MPIYLLYSYKTFNKNYVIVAEDLSYNKGKNVRIVNLFTGTEKSSKHLEI
jgi:hypothetical protein